MKKITVLFVILSMAFLLAACGGSAEPVEIPVETAVEPTLPPAPATATLLPPPVVSQSGGEGDTAVASEEPAPPTPAPAIAEPQTLPVWPADRFGYGVQVHGDATVSDQGTVMDVVKNQLGMDWVKTQIRWNYAEAGRDEYQWFFYDATLNEAAEKGLYTLVSVVAAPDWSRSYGLDQTGKHGPPDNYQDYYDFLRTLLERYPDKIDAVEVWNEQNLDREWLAPNGLSAADYTAFLKGAYETIKSVNPDVIVVSGALSPTGGWTEPDGTVTALDDFVYLDQMIQAGFLNYADCVGVHHNGINLPPDVAYDQTGSLPESATASFRGPFDNPHHSWSFKTTLDVTAEKVRAVDPNKKLCITEFGWATREGLAGDVGNFGFANDNTLDEQAQYIVQAFNQMRDSGYVWIATLFNFDFGNKGTDDPALYSLIDSSGIPRPAFGAVAAMEKDH
ncbi:MAG: hypothetical protein H6667_25730 [Ardenticatenaceae bacterium]|nr:hypothetical protein [Ardenticatenaceae bacterium]